MDNKYRFVNHEGNWLLKITTIEQFEEYADQIEDNYDRAFRWYLTAPSEIEEALNGDFELSLKHRNNENFRNLQYLHLFSSRKGVSFIDGINLAKAEKALNLRNTITTHGEIFINQAGGYQLNIEYENWIDKNEFVWPNFTEKDIRIEQWGGEASGSHYYAYIGNLHVREGKNNDVVIKWNTREEALNAAKKILEKS